MWLRVFGFIICSTLFVQQVYALSLEDSRHLLNRTGFAPSFAEANLYQDFSKDEAIEYRINELLENNSSLELPYKFWLPYQLPFNNKTASREQRQEYRKLLRKDGQQLQQLWIQHMIATDNPMRENLTLFWHNHFVSSMQKVKHPALMANQNQTLRYFSAGHFGDFLKAMLQDPALLKYLDNQKNRKGKINENLARELFELFTLGEGHYSEKDIQEAARALSGYGLKHKTGEFRFAKKQHDDGRKTIFRKTGNWNTDDLVELILKQKQTARFITAKLWNHYITTPIPHPVLNRLSRDFYNDYQIAPLIKAILNSSQFWSAQNRGTKIKDPINLVVGVYRQFEMQPKKLKPLVNAANSMGQILFNPPNVKGWNTNTGWINTTTLLNRQSAMAKLTRGMQLQRQVNRIDQRSRDWQALLIAKNLHKDIEYNRDSWTLVKTSLNHLNYQLE